MKELNLTPFESRLFAPIKAKKNINKKKEIIKGIAIFVFWAVIISDCCISIASLSSRGVLLILLLFFIWSSCFLLIP